MTENQGKMFPFYRVTHDKMQHREDDTNVITSHFYLFGIEVKRIERLYKYDQITNDLLPIDAMACVARGNGRG